MVDVTDRSDVAMRLGTLKLRFGHSHPSLSPAHLARHLKTRLVYSRKTPLFKPELLGQSRVTMPGVRLIYACKRKEQSGDSLLPHPEERSEGARLGG
jgi:hypothetical protein